MKARIQVTTSVISLSIIISFKSHQLDYVVFKIICEQKLVDNLVWIWRNAPDKSWECLNYQKLIHEVKLKILDPKVFSTSPASSSVRLWTVFALKGEHLKQYLFYNFGYFDGIIFSYGILYDFIFFYTERILRSH